MRYQDPDVEQRNGWYQIRVYVPVITPAGGIERQRKAIRLGRVGQITESEAKRQKILKLGTVNAGACVIEGQIKFSELVAKFRDVRMPALSSTTRAKYEHHIDRHILPFFGDLMLCEVDLFAVERWLATKSALAYNTRVDLRALLRSMFHQARKWRLWTGDNPAAGAEVGRRTGEREKVLLTETQLLEFLAAIEDSAALPAISARLVCLVAIVGGLRVSEVLGLQVGDIDGRTIKVRRRWCRGDVADPKSERSRRVVHIGPLAADLAALSDSGWVFRMRGTDNPPDDRRLQRDVFRPAAKAAGCYHVGFGMHSFRRLNVTWRQEAGATPFEAMRAAGHSRPSTTWLYTLPDARREEQQAEAILERLKRRATA